MSMPMRFGDALLRERGGGPQGGPVFSKPRTARPGIEWRGRYAPQGGAAVDAVLECVGGGAPRRMCVGACAPDAVGG